MEKLESEASETSSHHAKDFEEVGRRQMIEAKLQDIVEDVNENRKRHADTLAKFKQDLDKQAQNVFTSVENKVYDVYEAQQPLIDGKLQQLYDTLGRIATLEQEIQEFTQSLACLYQDTVQK